ncbi:MAG: response regulator [Ktedonobacteraceae bacterium]
MNTQGRVLVVDDLEPWREQLVETLQQDGFYAASASTATEVLEQLDEALYHLLILDIRLADTDPGNIDGIDLLRELEKRGLSEATKVIMLSAHDTKEHMRLAFRDYKVADFLSKDNFTKQLFLESVRRVFSQEANINLALTIHWQQVRGPEQAVLNLEIRGTRVKRNSPLQSQIATELNDLLCRLFYEAESVLLRPLTAGQSATGVLWAQPFYARGGGRAVIVKFGDFRKIEQEHTNFRKYVQPFIGGGRNTTVLDLRRTPHLGGITYSLLGADSEHMEDFGSFYRHADGAQIQTVLDRLFLDTCGAWYANPGQLQPYNLTEDYQQLLEFTSEKLEHALAEMQKFVQGRQKLHFKSLHNERLFTNPLLAITGPPLVCSTYTCPTHGDFNQHNLLVDRAGHTWLIDFQATGPGHILRDVAQLDSEIRFLLLAPDEATLEECLCMEEALCSVERFSNVPELTPGFPTENQALAKTYATVVHLRILTRKLIAQNPSDDMSEYYIALFYNAVNTIRYASLPSRQREHALLSASILADRLGLKG